MASHDQINRNIRDVNSAWGYFQRLVHVHLPTKSYYIDNARRMLNTTRRYVP